MVQKIRKHWNTIKHVIRTGYKKTETAIERRPLVSFLSALGVLLILIIVSNFLSSPKTNGTEAAAEKKEIKVYTIGTAPKISAQAQIEKTGVITITALMSGVINQINVYEGMRVGQGANLIWMTSNYQGGNVFSLQRQLAETQYNNVIATYNTQKSLIDKQREVADKSKSNTDELRDITSKSVDETKSLIDLNEDVADSLSNQITDLENSGADEATIRTQKQILSQVLAGLLQTRSALRQTEYQVNTDKPPTKLAELQHDITIQQLALQERTLNLSVEVSRLQLQIAQVTEATMHPVAPASGVVQKVHVRLGQAVNPGTPLVTISGDVGELNAVAYVPQSVAQNISRMEPSFLYIGKNKVSASPIFISEDATEGNLYSIKYAVPAENYSEVTDKGFVRVEIPIGYADTTAAMPYIPLDAIYQSKSATYVFVNNKGVAKSRELTLGPVYGQFVQVETGLGAGDRVIVNRNVIEGDKVVEE